VDRRPLQPAFLKQSFKRWPSSTLIASNGEEIDQRQGINHYGFLVDNVDELSAGWTVAPARRYAAERPAGGDANLGPWGNKSGSLRQGISRREEKSCPACAMWWSKPRRRSARLNFYKSVFELRETGNALMDRSV